MHFGLHPRLHWGSHTLTAFEGPLQKEEKRKEGKKKRTKRKRL